MANEYYISAGIICIDNSSGADPMSYYISAGIVPDDEAAGGISIPVVVDHYKDVGGL
jgi:hypothetical protein